MHVCEHLKCNFLNIYDSKKSVRTVHFLHIGYLSGLQDNSEKYVYETLDSWEAKGLILIQFYTG